MISNKVIVLIEAAPGNPRAAFVICRKGPGVTRYSSSNGISGVTTNCPLLTLAGLSGCGASAVFAGGGGGLFSCLSRV